MTWICSFGVVNCPICQRARDTIKTMMPNVPDKVIDKAIKEQKIDLHQKVEEISIGIIAGGEPRIEIKGKPVNKDGNPKIGMDNPDNPFFNRNNKRLKVNDTILPWSTISIKEDNTDPWEMDKNYIWDIDEEVSSDSFIGVPFTTSVKEGDYQAMSTSSSWFIEPGPTFPISETELRPLFPSDYRTIGRPVVKETPKMGPKNIVPTSKLYKDMKNNYEPEFYRKQGIKAYKASDGKQTLIVDRKSEIQFQ